MKLTTYLFIGSLIVGWAVASIDVKCPQDPGASATEIAAAVVAWPAVVVEVVVFSFHPEARSALHAKYASCKSEAK